MPDCRHWRLDVDDAGIAWLCIDKADSGVNVLSREVLEEFEAVLAAIAARLPAGLVIYSGKPQSFIAGADINEFPRIRTARAAYELTRRGHQILGRLESLSCNTVAVIDGHALGGGLELALACDWRLGIEGTQRTLGLPEVQLGLHPGFGGTVRAVRLLGVREGMALMLTGKPITPRRAADLGLLDRIIDAAGWREAARDLVTRPPPERRVPLPDRLLAMAPARPLLARLLRRQIAQKASPEHYPAPYAMVDLWQRYAASGDAAFDAEARSFARLVESDTSRNLVRVYFLQERLKKTGGKRQPAVERVHVVGAGIMGGDIAAWCALRGLRVSLQDREMKYIEPALERAAELFGKRAADPDETLARLVADVDGNHVENADLVIEAIFENRDAKQALFRDLEPRMKKGAILATNTSSIPLEELAPALSRPQRLIGLHFFNPVAKLPLVEVVSAGQTAADSAERGAAFTRQIGKLPLPCRSHPGFLVNRILAPYMAEALELLREGVPPEAVDRAAVRFGMPMGPIELTDSVGLDVALHVAEILAPVIGREVAPELRNKVEAGDLGRKSGRGFYRYRNGRPVRQRITDQAGAAEMQDRLILALLNESAACLADGVVADDELVDAGVIFGTGFAPFRGGPIHYARSQGIAMVVNSLERLATAQGPRFRPSAGWERLAES